MNLCCWMGGIQLSISIAFYIEVRGVTFRCSGEWSGEDLIWVGELRLEGLDKHLLLSDSHVVDSLVDYSDGVYSCRSLLQVHN
jgi:hypothetical protein